MRTYVIDGDTLVHKIKKLANCHFVDAKQLSHSRVRFHIHSESALKVAPHIRRKLSSY